METKRPDNLLEVIISMLNYIKKELKLSWINLTPSLTKELALILPKIEYTFILLEVLKKQNATNIEDVVIKIPNKTLDEEILANNFMLIILFGYSLGYSKEKPVMEKPDFVNISLQNNKISI